MPFVRAKVGDRHIMEALHQRQWMLKGEPSGHILTLDLCSTGDAIIAGLVLVAMQDAGLTLSEVASGSTKAPQLLINVMLNHQQRFVDTPIWSGVLVRTKMPWVAAAVFWLDLLARNRCCASWSKGKMTLRWFALLRPGGPGRPSNSHRVADA